MALLVCWNGCEIDRSGLSSGVERPGGSGGHVLPPDGTGGLFESSTGGSIHFGTGGAGWGTGGHATGGASGGHDVPDSGGGAGTIANAGSGGDGSAGQGTGGQIFGSGGGAGQTTGTGGGAGGPGGPGGGGGPRTGGRGGPMTSTGGNWGSGGWWNGGGGRSGSTGGSEGGLPMCDPSIRDKDSCTSGAPDCTKTCGVSALATKPCTCTNRQWSCGDCVYPSGDYSCYQVPSMSPPPCPMGTTNGMTACTGSCTLCSNYMDTSGMAKMGYCACSQDPGDSSRLYHCASSAEWPPQQDPPSR